MRYIGLLIIFVSLPLFIAALGRKPQQRDWAIFAIGLLVFCTGPLNFSVSLISWPAWQGLSKGVILSLIDTLALALLLTRPSAPDRPHFIPLLALFLAPTLISVLVAPVKMAAFFMVIQFAQQVLLYLALGRELQRPSAMRNLMKGLAAGLILQAGYVIDQKLHGAVQATGTMAHQNILGMIVELSALTLFAAVLEGERSKVVYTGLVAAMIVIAGGGSRGTMLYAAIGTGVVLVASLLRNANTRKWSVAGLLILALLLVVPLAAATLKERFGNSSVTAEEAQRAAFERAARAMAADHPVGIGANNFVSVNNTGGYAAKAGLDWGWATRSKPAHNAYLVARAETGWAGELALISLLWGLSVAGLRVGFRKRKTPFFGLALGASGAVAAAALHSNYEYAILTLETQRFVFVDAAIIAACLGVMQRAARQRVGSQVCSEDTSHAIVDCTKL